MADTSIPEHLRYTEDHEWVEVEDDIATIGITDYAQSELGDIVFVELPETGKSFKAGDVLGTIESVKAVSEIFSPVSGSVVEVNETLNDKPEVINEDPNGAGWYCRIQLDDPAEIDGLMDAQGYEELIGQ